MNLTTAVVIEFLRHILAPLVAVAGAIALGIWLFHVVTGDRS